MEKEKQKGGAGKAFLGIFLIYVIYVVSSAIVGGLVADLENHGSEIVSTLVISSLIIAILLLYEYGILGMWLAEFGDYGTGGSRSPALRGIGKVFGTIGFFLRPFPIIVYGANKKKYLYFTVVIPLLIFGIVCVLFGMRASNILFFQTRETFSSYLYFLAATAWANALLVLTIKKCPNCKCVMSEIDYDYLSIQQEQYTRDHSEELGSVKLENGESATVYGTYRQQYTGNHLTYAKTYTCLNCGTRKQGAKFSVSERDVRDNR